MQIQFTRTGAERRQLGRALSLLRIVGVRSLQSIGKDESRSSRDAAGGIALWIELIGREGECGTCIRPFGSTMLIAIS